MEVACALAVEPQVHLYFGILGYSLLATLRGAGKGWQVAFALFSISVTWYLIITWIVEYKQAGGNSIFDDAYVDVLQGPHFNISSQLLTWAAIAIVWAHTAPIHMQLFGFLGAMSAAYACWSPNIPHSPRYIPVSHFLCALMAIYCTNELQPLASATQTSTGAADFAWWLRLLHIVLLVPTCTVWLFPKQPRCDGRWVYLVLGVAVAYFHMTKQIDGGVSPPWIVRWTKCQLSITTDLVLCGFLTLNYIHTTSSSNLITLIATLAMPLVTPGAVLALYLAAMHSNTSHRDTITWMQRHLARGAGSPEGWMNIGLWGESYAETSASSTDEKRSGANGTEQTGGRADACKNLALRLANAVLNQGDRLLVCGCGLGAELKLYQDEFSLKHVTGIDPNPDGAKGFAPTGTARLMCMDASQIAQRFPHGLFNKIVALDSVYHFNRKETFFCDAKSILPGGGRIGVTDIILSRERAPLWLKMCLIMMNVPLANVWTHGEYVSKLEKMGYVDVRVEVVRGVLDRWFPAALLKLVSYSVVTASVPMSGSGSKRPKVAIIGSGMAGMSAASKLCATCDVTVFEGNDRIGLSGNQVVISEGVCIDAPLRMYQEDYYGTFKSLVTSVGVESVSIPMTYCFHGTSAPEGVKSFVGTQNPLWNFMALCRHWSDPWRLSRCLKKSWFEKGGVEGGVETWGQWLDRHGFEGECGKESKAKSCTVWVLSNHFSWMLSCSLAQLRACPVEIMLGFSRRVGITAWNCMDSRHTVHRVYPSISALSNALAYGSDVKLAKKVGPIGRDRIIEGVEYDKVIIAAEAPAVPLIVPWADPDPNANMLSSLPGAGTSMFTSAKRQGNSVFDRVEYHPSRICIHRDPSMMPQNRSDWQMINVRHDVGQDMAELTVWLNRYYPDLPHQTDVFQTWNPFRTPGNVIKELHFMRCLHTRHTAALVKKIEGLQGKGGLYYAGAYTCFGMGLLEQAAQSGLNAASLVLEDISDK